MLVMEIIYLCSLSAWFIQYILPARLRTRYRLINTGLCLVIFFVHLAAGYPRWQLAALYLTQLFLLVRTITGLVKSSRLSVKTDRTPLPVSLGFISFLLMIGLTLYTNWAVPLTRIPPPTGPYTTGTTRFILTDPARRETLTPADQTGSRRIVVQAWYPAGDITNQPLAPYIPGQLSSFARAAAALMQTPVFVYSHLAYLSTHSRLDAPVQPGYWPVVIFSPGYGATEYLYTAILEELASYGYILFSLNHPYDSLCTWFGAEDEAVMQPPGLRQGECSALRGFRRLMREEASLDIRMRRMQAIQACTAAFPTAALAVRLADIRCLAGLLPQPTAAGMDLFDGHLDLHRLAVCGHSLGGVAATRVCLEPGPFKAGVNLDGFVFTMDWDSRLQVPFYFIYTTANLHPITGETLDSTGMNSILADLARAETRSLALPGTRHLDFTDSLYLFPVLRLMGQHGAMPPHQFRFAVTGALLEFFQQQL